MANNEYKMVADYNVWRAGNKDKDLWAIHDAQGKYLFDVLDDDYEEMFDLDLVEDGYMLERHTDEELMAYQKRWGILWTAKQPEERSVWMRVGVTMKGTAEEIEALFNDNEHAGEVFEKLMKNHQYEIDGNSYIPESCVDSYNEEYGTSHPLCDYDVTP